MRRSRSSLGLCALATLPGTLLLLACGDSAVAPPATPPPSEARITFIPLDYYFGSASYDSMPVLAGRMTTVLVAGRDSAERYYTGLRVRWSSSSGSFDSSVTSNGHADKYGFGEMRNTWRPGLGAGLATITVTSTYDSTNTGTFHARVYAAPLQLRLLDPKAATVVDTAPLPDSVRTRVTTVNGVPVSGVRIEWDAPTPEYGFGFSEGTFGPGTTKCGIQDRCTITDADGRAAATFRAEAFRYDPGPHYVVAKVPTMGLVSDSLLVTVSPAPPGQTTLFIAGGNHQTGRPGQTLPLPLTVLLVDAAAHPIAGQSIEWALAGTPDQQAGASLAASVTVTDAQGRAGNQWTVGSYTYPIVGTQFVMARLPGAADPSPLMVMFEALVSAQ
jgi:hypothetical protein